MAARKPQWVLLLALILILAAGQPAAAATTGRWPELKAITGLSWLVMDADSGEVLVQNQADLPMFPASTTKIMTAILVLEANRLDQVVTVSANAVKLPAGSSKVGYLEGEKVVVRDVLAGLMLASGNDAANILAEAYSGSQEAFAQVMNKKAAALGMTGSHFINPSGLHDPEHVTTARDMAKLAAYAMKNQRFRELVNTVTCSLPATNKHPYNGWALLINTNRFLQFGSDVLASDLISGYTGIKTGSTDLAGNNLVAAAETVSGHELVSVLFGVPLKDKTGNIFIYTRTLFEAAAGKIKTEPTPAATTETAPTAATSATGSETGASPTTGLTAQTSETSASEPTPVNGFDPVERIGHFFRENPWRAACLILLPALAIALAALLTGSGRRRRRNARPRRVEPRK